MRYVLAGDRVDDGLPGEFQMVQRSAVIGVIA